MTNELKEVVRKIDLEFKEYFKDDLSIKTIFVAGSMAKDDYEDRQDNDYDIRVISDNVTKEQLIKFEKFLTELSKKLTTNNLAVGYSTLVGPVNHKINSKAKNILIHALIHQANQMDDFLPATHKYQYGTRYRIVSGEDSLKRFQQTRFTLDDLLNIHEGLRYCLDMLRKQEYRYLSWDLDKEEPEFNFHQEKMPKETILENCFYAHNKFINNLINYCNWNNYEIPNDKMCFAIRLLGQDYCGQNTLFLLHSLFLKNEPILTKLFDNPLKETIQLLERYETRVQELDFIFPKKESNKVKKLIKN